MTHFIASAETLIIGRGRVATQLIHFFESRNLPFSNWWRPSENFQGQNQTQPEINLLMAYYLNGVRSPATLLGVLNPTAPNYYTARNVRN